ncbi:MAG TPA: serine hydrolase [Hyphomonadaceae bacterium]|nr:serine hydrolase [Hyphomonadaceae bacterium]
MLKPLALVAVLLAAGCATAGDGASPPPAKTSAASAGWNAAALADAVSYAQSQKTTGFLIIQDRKVIAESNWPLPADAETFKTNFVHGAAANGALREDVASAQKSFVAILAGVAIDKNLLDISKPVSFYAKPGWSKATPEQEAKITVRNLMEMNSGLKENLSYEAEPGSKFYYNTPAYAIMKPVLEGASKQKLDDLTRLWLTEPVGMSDTKWELRPGAFSNVGNPTGLVTTPRDIAKMGQLVLDGGMANGRRVISKTQLDFLFSRSPTNPSYGHLWWLNGATFNLSPGANAPRREGQLIPAAPADLVAALGAEDRKLYIVPSLKLLVVRTGQAAPDRDFNQQLWTRLMKAIPAK